MSVEMNVQSPCDPTISCGACCHCADVPTLQKRLAGALVGLARAAESAGSGPDARRAMLEGLFHTMPGVRFSKDNLYDMIDRVHAASGALTPGRAPDGDYDMDRLQEAEEDVRALKLRILSGLRDLSACACHAMALGQTDDVVDDYVFRGMSAVGADLGIDDLRSLADQLDAMNRRCLASLERARSGL